MIKAKGGEKEAGLCSVIGDRETMFRYMCAIFIAGLESGLLYATSERGEGYIIYTSTEGDEIKFTSGLKMIAGIIGAMGLKRTMAFLKSVQKPGISLEDQMKEKKKRFVKVEMLVVIKKYQGQGYMRQLMNIAYNAADKYGVPCILDTDGENKRDKSCHLGMKQVGIRKISEDSVMYDLIREK